jgi:hypothetical protein
MDWIASALARLAMTRNTNVPPVPGAMQRVSGASQNRDRCKRDLYATARRGTIASVTAPAQRRTTRVLRRVRGMHTRYLSFVIASGAKQSRSDVLHAWTGLLRRWRALQ